MPAVADERSNRCRRAAHDQLHCHGLNGGWREEEVVFPVRSSSSEPASPMNIRVYWGDSIAPLGRGGAFVPPPERRRMDRQQPAGSPPIRRGQLRAP